MPDAMIDRRVSPRYPLVLVAETREMKSRMNISERSSDGSSTGCSIDTLNPVQSGFRALVRLMLGKKRLHLRERCAMSAPAWERVSHSTNTFFQCS